MSEYSVIILGAGNTGMAVAGKARKEGRSVLVIESREAGGTCPLRGCVPKKVLVAAAEAMQCIESASAHGITVGAGRLDWERLIQRKQGFVEGVPQAFQASLSKRGIDYLSERARFVAPDAVEAGGQRYRARHIVIATGSKPRQLPIDGFEQAITSDDILDMKQRPESLVFIGAGVIGMEFSHVLARAGTRVTILEVADCPLPGLDRDLVDGLSAETRRLGVEIFTQARVQSIDAADGGLNVRFEHEGTQKQVEAEVVANGAGRVADVEGLGLQAGQVDSDNGRIRVDAYLRSVSNPKVYVGGDALASSPQLSALASYEGRLIGHNLTQLVMEKADYSAIPSVVFTVPALASVGLTQSEAEQKGLDFDTRFNDMKEWRSARTYAENAALSKVLLEKESGKILGAHLLGHGAQEVIHTFALAMKYGISADDLSDFIYAYPTFTSDVRFLI